MREESAENWGILRGENTEIERERERREMSVRVTGFVYWCVGMNPDEREWANEGLTRQ